MTEETLKRAKEIEKELTWLNFADNELRSNIYSPEIYMHYTKVVKIEFGMHSRMHSMKCSLPLDSFFSHEELLQRVNTRISELQKELDSL